MSGRSARWFAALPLAALTACGGGVADEGADAVEPWQSEAQPAIPVAPPPPAAVPEEVTPGGDDGATPGGSGGVEEPVEGSDDSEQQPEPS